MSVQTIFMPLIDEGTDVWAPVQAERFSDDTFLVFGPMPDDQGWRFSPNTIVAVERKNFSDGTEGLIVTGFVGVPEIMSDGWDGVQSEINRIVSEATEPFDAETLGNVRDLMVVLRERCPTPDAVDKGYWSTIRFFWADFEIEVFGDHLEGYRFHDQSTDIWHDDHMPGEAFSQRVLTELAAL